MQILRFRQQQFQRAAADLAAGADDGDRGFLVQRMQRAVRQTRKALQLMAGDRKRQAFMGG